MFIIFWNMLFTEDFPLYNIQETTKNEKKVRDAYPRDFYRLFLRE